MTRISIPTTDPIKTLDKLVRERYPAAKAVFWAGSVLQNNGTESSDLDLVIVFDSIANAYREAFIYDNWPIDAFIHDPDTLRYFFEKIESNDGKPALIQMILNGYEILGTNDFSNSIKVLAREAMKIGPTAWNKEQIDKERFLITDILDDIRFPKSRDEQVASAAHLFEPLIQFYFRSKNKWAASGKSLIRALKNDNPALALEFNNCFERLFKIGDASGLESLVQKILEPYGGLFWSGFRSYAPNEWSNNLSAKQSGILEELRSREPIFHHPDTFGTTEQDILNMMCNDFFEVGASGNIYSKQEVLQTLLERYSDHEYVDLWETKDFQLTQIAPNNYLLTYTLLQGERVTRRATIWRYEHGKWEILYHQGTVVQRVES